MERKTLKHSDNAEVESATSESSRTAAARSRRGFFLLHDALPRAHGCLQTGSVPPVATSTTSEWQGTRQHHAPPADSWKPSCLKALALNAVCACMHSHSVVSDWQPHGLQSSSSSVHGSSQARMLDWVAITSSQTTPGLTVGDKSPQFIPSPSLRVLALQPS